MNITLMRLICSSDQIKKTIFFRPSKIQLSVFLTKRLHFFKYKIAFRFDRQENLRYFEYFIRT